MPTPEKPAQEDTPDGLDLWPARPLEENRQPAEPPPPRPEGPTQ